MADFPVTLPTPSWQYFDQQPVKAQIKTPFESGKAQSRPKHTSMRWKFTIGWQALTQTQYATLYGFYDDYIGATFNWTHPVTSTVYTVRFGHTDALPKAKPAGFVEGVFSWTISGIILEQI